MCGRNFGNLLIPALAGMLVAERPTQLQPAQHAISQTTRQAVCPQCKTAVLSTFDWCPQCGQALRAQAKPQPCGYCGRTMATDAQFCSSCGAPAGKQ